MSEMTTRINKVLKAIASMEGGKSEVTVGNLREVYKCLAMYEATQVMKAINESDYDGYTGKEVYFINKDIEGQAAGVLREYKNFYLKKMIDKEFKS